MFEPRDDSDGNVAAIARREALLKAGRWLALISVLVALGYGTFRVYAGWHERHLAAQARAFLDRQDYASAALAARRVLQLDEQNLTACRVMAELSEAANRPEAVNWRERIAQLDPQPAENQFTLAAAALRFGQPELAGKVLAALPATARDSARYHSLAAAFAIGENQTTAAEAHLAAVVQLQPQDVQAQLSLATLRVSARDPAVANAACETLARLSAQPAIRLSALRSLASEALARNDRARAEECALALCATAGANASDALLLLESRQGTERAAATLAEIERRARGSSEAAAALITWMNRHEQAAAALAWAHALPDKIARANPVPLAVAESYSVTQDWSGLLATVSDVSWGESEFLRLAVQSHGLRRRQGVGRETLEPAALWRSAVKAVQGRPERLAALAQLADGWGYAAEAEAAWWMIADGDANQKSALRALDQHYQKARNSHGLLRVAQRAHELDPSDEVAANNCASLGLLLGRNEAAPRLAGKLYAKDPTSSVRVATYAFALHVQHRSADGLKLLDGLKEEQLRTPAIAAYYVVLLVDTEQMERAKRFLGLAQNAALLPEEQELLAEARRKIGAWETQHDTAALVHS